MVIMVMVAVIAAAVVADVILLDQASRAGMWERLFVLIIEVPLMMALSLILLMIVVNRWSSSAVLA